MDFKRKDEYDPALEDEFQEDSEMVETSGDKGGMTKRVAVLAGIGVLAAALLIAGLVKGCSGRKEEKPGGEYYGAAEPPVRCGESHLSGLTEPLHFVY